MYKLFVVLGIMITVAGCKPTKSAYPSLWELTFTGNNRLEFIRDKEDSNFYLDPVDDTVNFMKTVNPFYMDKYGRVYILTQRFCEAHNDTFLNKQYFKEVSDFIDLKSYKLIGRGYFINKGKVNIWRGNSCGEYPVEVTGADPATFRLIDRDSADAEDRYGKFHDGERLR